MGMGATVQAANQDQEVVTETVTVEKKVPVDVWHTDIKTVTVPAPAPASPDRMSQSCEELLATAADMYEITSRYSDRSSTMQRLVSEVATQSHMGDPDALDESRSALTELRSAEAQDLREMGALRFKYDNLQEECKADE